MKNKTIAYLSVAGAGLMTFLIICGMIVSISNKEVGLRNQIVAKQVDNQSELDNMMKKIKQVAQVSEKEVEAIKDIVTGYASARSGQGGGSLFTMVSESVPNQSPETLRQLSNLIAGSRDRWTQRQKELLDIKREHDNMIDMFPSSIIVGGRGKIDVKIVTSTRASDAMSTGVDDDVNVF